MVLMDNKGFSTGSFYWRHFSVVVGQNPTKTTGSDEPMPILLVDYQQAWNSYGAPIKGGSCPKCWGGLVNTELHFNPLSVYWFLICPICAKTFRFLNQAERLDDLTLVRSSKRTGFDENEDIPWYINF